VAVTLSGSGEALIRTQLAEKLASAVFTWDDMALFPKYVSDFLHSNFLQSPRLANFPRDRIQAGGLLLVRNEESSGLLAFHNTQHLPFAYSKGASVKKKVSMLEDRQRTVCELVML